MKMDGGGACGGGGGGFDDKTKKNKIIIKIMSCGELKTFRQAVTCSWKLNPSIRS
jgi:hypothetical protein